MCNDITQCTTNTGVEMMLYCDDTCFLKAIFNDDDVKKLQSAIDRLDKWSEENKLQLNPVKTFHMSYIKPKSPVCNHRYYLGNSNIVTKEVAKDLGVTFDSHLTFKQHIEDISTRAKIIYGMGYLFLEKYVGPRSCPSTCDLILCQFWNTVRQFGHN